MQLSDEHNKLELWTRTAQGSKQNINAWSSSLLLGYKPNRLKGEVYICCAASETVQHTKETKVSYKTENAFEGRSS